MSWEGGATRLGESLVGGHFARPLSFEKVDEMFLTTKGREGL